MDFKLERTDGTPADPPTYRTGVYAWRPGDTIPLSATRTLRVVAVRRDDPEGRRCWSLRTWPKERLAARAPAS